MRLRIWPPPHADGPAIGIGGPLAEVDNLYNAYFILQGGKITAQVRKHHLPNYAVFDEKRIFDPAPIAGPVRVGPLRIGTPICEDAWYPDVCEAMAESGRRDPVRSERLALLPRQVRPAADQHGRRVVENDLPLIYLNMVGGQDDQMFDGGSFALNRGGKLALQMPLFDEATPACRSRPKQTTGWVVEEGPKATHPDAWERDYRVMVEALRDYMAQDRVPESAARPVGRHRLRPRRDHRGRRAWGRKRPLRDAALRIHLARLAR